MSEVAINELNEIPKPGAEPRARNVPTATVTGAAKNSKVSLAAMREYVLKELTLDEDPNNLVAEVYQCLHGTNDPTKEMTLNLVEKTNIALGFENDYSLSATLGVKHAGLGIELRRNLIKNFQCTTYADKLLVDTVVSAHIRYLTCVGSFQDYLTQRTYLSREQIQFLGVLSKEMDRANRQTMTAYQMLVNYKQPSLKVQINTKNTFLAHHQQVNTTAPLTQDHTDG